VKTVPTFGQLNFVVGAKIDGIGMKNAFWLEGTISSRRPAQITSSDSAFIRHHSKVLLRSGDRLGRIANSYRVLRKDMDNL